MSLAISGVNFVQFIVPVPAMLLTTSEYATRSITFSLQCVPARTRLLLGKARVVAAFGLWWARCWARGCRGRRAGPGGVRPVLGR